MIVLVSAADTQGPRSRGMTLALEGALESGSIVLLRESAEPADEDLLAVAAAARADAIAAVTWSDSDRRVHLRLQRVGAGAPAERDIEFLPSDASVERGRTIGFALAAMIRSREDRPSSEVQRPPEPTPVAPAEERPEVHLEGASASGWGVDVAFTTMAGLGGAGSGIGGDVGVRRRLAPKLDFRLALGVTRGAVSGAGATLTIVRPRVGVGVEVLRRGALSFTLRFEAGPWLHVVDRSAPSSAGSRWVPALRAGGEIAWSVAPPVEATLDLGADLAFGTTRVLVGDEERASISPARLVGALGLRFVF